MDRKYDLYQFENIQAAAPSKSMAWMLIRNRCVELKIPIPTMDKIEFVRQLSVDEIKQLMQQSKQ